MTIEPMPGETELMIQLKTVKLHRVHKMNCGESRYGAGIVPSINRILCLVVSEMIINSSFLQSTSETLVELCCYHYY